jgi:hypothetical protein
MNGQVDYPAHSTTECIEGWVGPRAGVNAVEKRKISCPYREPNPGSAALCPSLYRLTYLLPAIRIDKYGKNEHITKHTATFNDSLSTG